MVKHQQLFKSKGQQYGYSSPTCFKHMVNHMVNHILQPCGLKSTISFKVNHEPNLIPSSLSNQRYRVTVNSFHVRVSSQSTLCITVARVCGVWIVAALFTVASALSIYLCNESIVLVRKAHCKLVIMFELLVSCVLPLCVVVFTYVMTTRHFVESSRSVSEGTQNPQLNTLIMQR
jgi:hypothetical protein